MTYGFCPYCAGPVEKRPGRMPYQRVYGDGRPPEAGEYFSVYYCATCKRSFSNTHIEWAQAQRDNPHG